jgi:hypothetical protein
MKMNHLYPSLILATVVIVAACNKSNNNPSTPLPPAPKVYAGADQTIFLPVDSVTLTGSAHDSVSKITGYSWTEVSGPNTPLLVTDGNSTTQVKGLTVGSYIFQLMAVDSMGQTGVDTVSVLVKADTQAVVQTVVLRTLFTGTSYSPYELTILANSASPAGNAADIELLAETWTIYGTEVWGRSFFKFNTSPIPANAVIKSATLNLFSDTLPQNGDLIHANYGTTNDFWIQRVATSWDQTTNYNTEPTLDTTGAVHIPQTSLSFLNLSVDVTTMFNSMLTNGNNGFAMRLNTEQIYNSRIFCSSAYSDSTRHPYLTVTYSVQQ